MDLYLICPLLPIPSISEPENLGGHRSSFFVLLFQFVSYLYLSCCSRFPLSLCAENLVGQVSRKVSKVSSDIQSGTNQTICRLHSDAQFTQIIQRHSKWTKSNSTIHHLQFPFFIWPKSSHCASQLYYLDLSFYFDEELQLFINICTNFLIKFFVGWKL